MNLIGKMNKKADGTSQQISIDKIKQAREEIKILRKELDKKFPKRNIFLSLVLGLFLILI
jgi:hypothetical protein